jgi:PAS domain S-box-containing protein
MQGEPLDRLVLNAVSRSLDEGLLVVAADDRVLHVNHRYGEVWGLAPGALLHEQAAPLRSLATSAVAGALSASSAALGAARQTFQLHDGRIVERSVTRFHVTGGAVSEIERVRDVTEARAIPPDVCLRNAAMLVELQQAVTLRDGIFNATPDGIVICREDGMITRVNAQAEAMFGYGPGELPGQPVEVLVPLEQRSGHASMRGSYLLRPSSREMAATRRLVAIRKDGTEIPVEINLGHLGAQGASFVLCVIRDATERRRAEEALRSTEEQLRQAQKMEAIGQLAGGVAHDFNNLLSIILGSAEFLLDDLGPDHASRSDVDEIHIAARRAADLTRQLLAFGRRQVLKPKVVDAKAVVSAMESMLRRLIGEHIELETQLADVRSIRIDPCQLEQVVMNLALNARDAMPRGGRLTVELATVDCVETASTGDRAARAPCIRLSVSDTGTGMSAETQARIFEPFFTTKELGRGTGLGLSTVFGIVRQSHGEIAVRSSPGAGTTFHLLFPVVDERVTPTPPTPRGPVRGGLETILLVEDEEAVRKLVSTVLRRAGYGVLAAADATSAMALETDFVGPIHLLITDVIMPGMNGTQLAKHLRARRPDLRVMFMSGYTDEAIEDGCLDAGVAFLQKPVTPHSLARKVREALES